MADDPDPPRRFYDLIPKEFERVNAPRSPLPGEPVASVPAPAVSKRSVEPVVPTGPATPGAIDIHELHRQAATPGPVLSSGHQPVAENEVHAILRDNLEREKAAGVHDLPPTKRKRSRRKRDYFLVIISTNVFFGMLAFAGFGIGLASPAGATLFVCSIAGMVFVTTAATWVMWVLMDDY